MQNRISLTLAVIGASLGLGILGDGLLRAVPPGLGWTLWGLALFGTGAAVARAYNREHGRAVGLWLAMACGAAVLISVRDSVLLKVLDVFAAVCCVVVAVSATRGVAVFRQGVEGHLRGALESGLGLIAEPIDLLANKLQKEPALKNASFHPLYAMARGVAVALPFLLIFGMLFVHADAAFASMVESIFRVAPETWANHGFLFVFATTLACATVSLVTEGGKVRTQAIKELEQVSLGHIEVATVLGLVNTLFFVFVLFQIPYFFGSASHVMTETGPSFSEYARRGFFELCTVAALVLPTLMGFEWLLRNGSVGARLMLSMQALALIGLVLVIMASAMHRMALYTEAYGLTELRFYTVAFMLLLAVVFGWFSISALRGHRDLFPTGAIVAGLVSIVLLHGVNPDGWIAGTNMARAQKGLSLDTQYLTQLSADAVPAMMKGRTRLPAAIRLEVDVHLRDVKSAQRDYDWRMWSWGQSRARQALKGME